MIAMSVPMIGIFYSILEPSISLLARLDDSILVV